MCNRPSQSLEETIMMLLRANPSVTGKKRVGCGGVETKAGGFVILHGQRKMKNCANTVKYTCVNTKNKHPKSCYQEIGKH